MIVQTLQKQSIRNIAIYLRLSKDDGDREESESISNQRAIILDFINKNFNYNKYFEYVDDGVSGATFNRPSFNLMIKELEENEIDLVITKNLARFGRNYIDAGDYIEKLFPNKNIRYIAILDGVDNFEDKIANEFAPIKGVFNELFCKETSKSVKRSKRKKMQEGFYCCNVAPYGYIKDPEEHGKLIIDKVASKVVKRIFKLKLDGMTDKQIADTLNKEKVLTPSEYLQVKGLENRTKKIWTRNIVTRILCNQVYIGNCLRGKTQSISYKSKKRINVRRNEQIITQNTHEAIIDEETFFKIHNTGKYGAIKKEREDFNARLVNYMYCGRCKSPIAKRKSRNFLNIHCPYREQTDYLCTNNELYKYDEIEGQIINILKKEFDIYIKKNNLNPSLIKRYNLIKIEKINEKVNDINKEVGIIKFKISKLYNDRLQEHISEEDYKKYYSQLTEKRKEFTDQIKIYEEEINRLENDTEEISKSIKKMLKNLDKNYFTSEEMGELIDRIEIYEDHIHIYYKFEKMPSKNISC